MIKVSIITPFYNPSPEIFDISISSIEKQTSKDFEWIQINDGSDNQYKYYGDVVLDKNYGPSVARNIGFQISSGNIITYLDMGDELDPNRVENLIKLFDNYNMELIFSAYNIVEGDVKERFDHFNWIGRASRFPTAVEYIKLLQYQNITVPLGVAHTRRPFVQVGGFQRGIVCGEDGILWRRMVGVIPPTNILFSDDVAGTYYVSNMGQSRTQRRFEMGGFAFDGSRNDNGRYLDESWYKNFTSEELYD